MPDNVVHLDVEQAAKAERFLNNVNSPKPKDEAFGAAMKARLEQALNPIQEEHRRIFIFHQLGEMDKFLNLALKNWNVAAIAEENISHFQTQLSYVLLLIVAPGDVQYTKALLKLAQCNAKAVGAYMLYGDDESALQEYRKARKLVTEATITLGQVSGCIGYVDDRTIEMGAE